MVVFHKIDGSFYSSSGLVEIQVTNGLKLLLNRRFAC